MNSYVDPNSQQNDWHCIRKTNNRKAERNETWIELQNEVESEIEMTMKSKYDGTMADIFTWATPATQNRK